MSQPSDRDRYAAGLGWLAAVSLSGVGFAASDDVPFVGKLAIGVAIGLVAFAAVYFAIRGFGRK